MDPIYSPPHGIARKAEKQTEVEVKEELWSANFLRGSGLWSCATPSGYSS